MYCNAKVLRGASVTVFLLALQLMARELALRQFVAALKPSLIPPFGGVQTVMCIIHGILIPSCGLPLRRIPFDVLHIGATLLLPLCGHLMHRT